MASAQHPDNSAIGIKSRDLGRVTEYVRFRGLILSEMLNGQLRQEQMQARAGTGYTGNIHGMEHEQSLETTSKETAASQAVMLSRLESLRSLQIPASGYPGWVLAFRLAEPWLNGVRPVTRPTGNCL